MVSKLFSDKIESYLKYSKVLDEISNKQKSLKPPVKFQHRIKRVKKLLQIKEKGNKILEKLSKEKNVPNGIIDTIKAMVQKADHMKRENCLLQISGPVGVLKSHELSIFREKSRNGMLEIRKYFCLHKNLFYDDGICIAMAFTKPKTLQNYHSHTHMNEYTTILSGSILIKAKIGKTLKTLKASEGDIIFVKRHTVHTLKNNSSKDAINVTVKPPVGFTDRISVDKIPKKHKGEIQIIRPKTIKKEWGKLRSKVIKGCGVTYNIFIMSINPSMSLELSDRRDTIIYVIQGSVDVLHKKNKKIAKKGYVIFVQKRCIIKNLSKKIVAKLYCVKEIK